MITAETMSYVIMDVGILILCNHNTLDIHTLSLSQFVGSNSYTCSFAKLAATFELFFLQPNCKCRSNEKAVLAMSAVLLLDGFNGAHHVVPPTCTNKKYVMLVTCSSACLTDVHGRSFVSEPNVGQR